MSMRPSPDVSEPFLVRLRAVACAAAALGGALGRVRRARVRSAVGDGVVLSSGRNDGPPDLDELWKDFNGKLSNLFGNKKGPRRMDGGGDGGAAAALRSSRRT